MPAVLRDLLVETFNAEPDMRIVDRSETPPDATSEMVAKADADVVIVGLEAGEGPLICGGLLRLLPGLKVAALEGQGRSISIYELRPTRTMLGPLSPMELVASIRRALSPMPLATRTLDGSVADAAAEEDVSLRLSLTRPRPRP